MEIQPAHSLEELEKLFVLTSTNAETVCALVRAPAGAGKTSNMTALRGRIEGNRYVLRG